MKILILGYLPATVNDYVKKAKTYGVNPDDLVFINDNFDANKISNKVYCDVFISELPHQFKGVHGKNLITIIKQHPKKYPKLHTSCIAGGSLKPLSISNFETYLKESVYFKINCLNGNKIENKIKNRKSVVKPQVKKTKAPRRGTTYQNWLNSH